MLKLFMISEVGLVLLVLEFDLSMFSTPSSQIHTSDLWREVERWKELIQEKNKENKFMPTIYRFLKQKRLKFRTLDAHKALKVGVQQNNSHYISV